MAPDLKGEPLLMPPATTVEAAFELFSRPRRHQRTDAELALLARAERSLVPHGAEELALWSWGTGPIVLMVHGWEGRGSQFHAFVPRLLKRGLRVVAMDAPAHGDSSGTATSIPDMAAAVLTVAGAIGEIAALIGHSGGSAASVYAFTRGLTVTASAHLAGPCSLERGVERFCSAAGLTNADRVAFRGRVEDFIGMRLCDTDLAKLSLPGHSALLLHDRTDREVPFIEAELLAAAWQTATLTPIEGVGHRRIMQSDAAIDRAVQLIGGKLDALLHEGGAA
jgi:pimeloyl-ACP methyl ester carboxylesterase